MILRYRANAVYRSESGDTPCIRLPVVLEGSSEAMHSWMLPYRTVPDSIHSGHPQPPPAQYPLPYQYARTEPTRRAGLSLFVLSLSPSPRPFIIAGFSSFPVPLLFLLFLSFFFSFLFSSSHHRVFSQLCLDIDRLFPFFWPPQPVFGVLSHGRRQTVRRLWPPESLLRFLAIVLYLLLSTLLRLDLIESSSSWCF